MDYPHLTTVGPMGREADPPALSSTAWMSGARKLNLALYSQLLSACCRASNKEEARGGVSGCSVRRLNSEWVHSAFKVP